jgi:hypothetical protein
VSSARLAWWRKNGKKWEKGKEKNKQKEMPVGHSDFTFSFSWNLQRYQPIDRSVRRGMVSVTLHFWANCPHAPADLYRHCPHAFADLDKIRHGKLPRNASFYLVPYTRKSKTFASLRWLKNFWPHFPLPSPLKKIRRTRFRRDLRTVTAFPNVRFNESHTLLGT